MTDPARAYLVMCYLGLVLLGWGLVFFGLTRRSDSA
jgi:hypothetical protein